MNKINRFRKRVMEMYYAEDFEEAAKSGEALLREHWNNHSMMTLGYANDIYNLARVYEELGDLERAVELYTDGAHLYSRQCTGDSAAYTDCLNNLAAALHGLGMEEPAFHLFGQLVNVKRFFKGEPGVDFADSLYNLANASADTKRIHHARKWHTEALGIRREAGNAQDILDSLHSMAFLHEDKGEYEKAAALAETALDLAQGDDYAPACHYLAELYNAWGRYEKALPLYEEIKEMTLQRVGKTHHSYLESLTRLALLLAKMERTHEALKLHEEARALYESAGSVGHPSYTQCLHHLAGLYKQLGENDQAEMLMMRSLKIRRKKEADITEDISFLIRLYLHMQLKEKALEMLVYALMLSDSKGPGLVGMLTKLAEAFQNPGDPEPDETMLQALRAMNDRVSLQPIIEKWTRWEKDPFIPAFVMPPPIGPGTT
jgi:tetratricopeptide (TPR) repeat protein